MRPISKGRPSKIYKEYGDAKPDLYLRLGLQCCYCEQHVKLENIAVEHIFPKEKHSECRLLWSNFLLTCTLCNSTKKDADIFYNNVNDYIFPDRDDTYKRIVYKKEMGFQPTANRQYIDYQRAQNTIDLYIKKSARPTRKHLFIVTERASRWKKEGDDAEENREIYLSFIDQEKRNRYLNQIKKSANDSCWSIWMHAFEDIPEVKETILYALPNTAIEYFIDDYWEHEQYFKERHTQQEYYYRLLVVIRIRTVYIAGHIKKLSPFQKEGIIDWITNFVREVRNKIQFTPAQIIKIDAAIATLKAM